MTEKKEVKISFESDIKTMVKTNFPNVKRLRASALHSLDLICQEFAKELLRKSIEKLESSGSMLNQKHITSSALEFEYLDFDSVDLEKKAKEFSSLFEKDKAPKEEKTKEELEEEMRIQDRLREEAIKSNISRERATLD